MLSIAFNEQEIADLRNGLSARLRLAKMNYSRLRADVTAKTPEELNVEARIAREIARLEVLVTRFGS